MGQIIINADDFGLSQGVNRGIYHLFKQQVVTSASFMVNLPGFDQGIQILRADPWLSVGLHLNLTYGRPLLPQSEVETLVDGQGNFFKKPAQVLGKGSLSEMEKEFRAQAERFLVTGFRPTHLDTHHDLHVDLRVLRILIKLAKVYNIPVIRRQHPEELAKYGLRTTDACIQKTFWQDNGSEKWHELLANLPGGVTEIVCHPGYVDEDLIKISPWIGEREKELAFFLDFRVLQAIRASGNQLIGRKI